VKFCAYKSELSNFFLAFVRLELFSAACRPWPARSLGYCGFFLMFRGPNVLVVSELLARVPKVGYDDGPEGGT